MVRLRRSRRATRFTGLHILICTKASRPTADMQRLTHSIAFDTSMPDTGRHRMLVLLRSAFSMRDRMEEISATARIHHTSCRRCLYWTADGYRSDTQGLPPRYADRGSADESRERGCRGAYRRADAARLHARSKPDIRSPWCGGQNEPKCATNGGTGDTPSRRRGVKPAHGRRPRQVIGPYPGH